MKYGLEILRKYCIHVVHAVWICPEVQFNLEHKFYINNENDDPGDYDE